MYSMLEIGNYVEVDVIIFLWRISIYDVYCFLSRFFSILVQFIRFTLTENRPINTNYTRQSYLKLT